MTEDAINFLNVRSIEDLSKCLSCSVKSLKYYCKIHQSTHLYTTFSIPKKNGSYRDITAPTSALKSVQKRLSKILYDIYEPKSIAHGFIREKNVVTNASLHVNKALILNIDIKDFFSSIHFGRVLGLFQHEPFNFPYDIALALTQLVCHNSVLPQGAPTSPIISNFICRSLDRQLKELAKKYRLLCTRYCDDISFSTKGKHFPQSIVYKEGEQWVIGEELKAILKKNSFLINEPKTRVLSQRDRQVVTGLVVNKKTNIKNKEYRKIRQILHYTYKNGCEEAALKNGYKTSNGSTDEKAFIAYLRGKLNYFKMVMGASNPRFYKLAEKYNECVEFNRFILPLSWEERLEKNVFIIETELAEKQGTGFLVKNKGLLTCFHNFHELSEGEISATQLLKKITNSRTKFFSLHKPIREFCAIKILDCSFKDDWVLLDIGTDLSTGFDISKNSFDTANELYSTASYPNYTKNSTIDILTDIKIRNKYYPFGMLTYAVDKTFQTGSSGGPVFSRENKVVGYIVRGNFSIETIEENVNGFAPLPQKLFD